MTYIDEINVDSWQSDLVSLSKLRATTRCDHCPGNKLLNLDKFQVRSVAVPIASCSYRGAGVYLASMTVPASTVFDKFKQ